MLAAIFKMAAKSIWDQKEKMETTFLSSIYYLEDFKTCFQDYTKKHNNIQYVDIYRRTIPVKGAL